MSEKKKDLKAFLAKQTKKVKKTTTTAETDKPAEEEEKQKDAEVINKDVKKTKDTKQESSDEEVDDELELEKGMDLGFAKIKEQKEVKGDKEQEESEKKGYGFDESAKPFARGTAIAEAKKAAGGDIVFGGSRPPKFGRKKVANGAFAAEFSEGLGDIDDDGKMKKKNKNTEIKKSENNTISAAAGGREWVNLGAGARQARDEDDGPREARPAAVKPTFKGRMNLTKTGAANDDDKDYGVKTNYGFQVSYKTTNDGEKGEGGERRERRERDKGVPFGQHEKEKNQDGDDEGFMVIKGRERKAKVTNNDSSDDEGGFEVKRGEERGARGGRGGGFFKNSSKRKD